MPGSDKKTRSRETFAAVFEEQTRRFSAFELLGLSSNSESSTALPIPPSPETPELSKLEVESNFISQAPILEPDSRSLELQPDSQGVKLAPDSIRVNAEQALKIDNLHENHSQAQKLRLDRLRQDLEPDSLAIDQTLDSQHDQTHDPQALGLRVVSHMDQTADHLSSSILGPDRRAQDHIPDIYAPLLAPLQWAVWEALQEADAFARTVSYRQLAKQTRSTIDGVRKAVRVLQKERGILTKHTVRTAQEQGFRVVVNREIRFRKGTINETKAILKRGLSLEQTQDRQRYGLGADGLRMFVCSNTNIRQTDIENLLRIPPAEWNIREQTLIQIADSLSEMTAIEFRLSIAYLVKQAQQSKEAIRNPNAWVKAAFEKNGRPLVTEREIEARLDKSPVKRETISPVSKGEGDKEELELLRRYLACNVNDRTEIDRIAEGKASSLFKIVSIDKHAGVMNAARLEAIREYFSK